MKLYPESLDITVSDAAIVREALLPSGELRKTRPVKKSGEGQYVWRMLVFSLSDKPAHHCLPVAAPFYLGDGWKDKETLDHLDAIVKKVVDSVPPMEQAGTVAWASAFGII